MVHDENKSAGKEFKELQALNVLLKVTALTQDKNKVPGISFKLRQLLNEELKSRTDAKDPVVFPAIYCRIVLLSNALFIEVKPVFPHWFTSMMDGVFMLEEFNPVTLPEIVTLKDCGSVIP